MSGLGNLKQITSGGEIQASVDVSLGSFIMQKVDFLEQFFSTFLLSELKALSLSESRENFSAHKLCQSTIFKPFKNVHLLTSPPASTHI